MAEPDCPNCGGTGKVVESSPYILGTPMSHSNSERPCDECGGRDTTKLDDQYERLVKLKAKLAAKKARGE